MSEIHSFVSYSFVPIALRQYAALITSLRRMSYEAHEKKCFEFIVETGEQTSKLM